MCCSPAGRRDAGPEGLGARPPNRPAASGRRPSSASRWSTASGKVAEMQARQERREHQLNLLKRTVVTLNQRPNHLRHLLQTDDTESWRTVAKITRIRQTLNSTS